MKYIRFGLNVSFIITLMTCFFPPSAEAYVGPGAGLSAIGVFLAVLFGIVIALVGFVWYPLKRLFRMMNKKRQDNNLAPK